MTLFILALIVTYIDLVIPVFLLVQISVLGINERRLTNGFKIT